MNQATGLILSLGANSFAFDDRPFDRKAKADFRASRNAEKQFAIKLRKIARHIGDIVSSLDDGTLASAYKIGEALARYSESLTLWADAATRRMHQEIAARDAIQWRRYAAEMGVELRKEIATAPTGEALRQLLGEQVDLITSLPREAAERVHKLTMEGLSGGGRSKEIVAEIMRTGDVTVSRATLIARTETARTASLLTQVRAQHAGSEAYVWETARDGTVRNSHRKMQGKIVRWDDPPTLDGLTGHCGQLPNCRCWARPLLSD